MLERGTVGHGDSENAFVNLIYRARRKVLDDIMVGRTTANRLGGQAREYVAMTKELEQYRKSLRLRSLALRR